MATEGNLHDLSLASLIQTICTEQIQARLTVKYADQEAHLYFDGGNIAHMDLGDREGEEVIYELLGWEEGTFALEKDVPPPTRTVTMNWSGLLLEGMRRLDEAQPQTGVGAATAEMGEGELLAELIAIAPELAEQLVQEIREEKEEPEMADNLNDILKELGEQVPGLIATSLVGMDGLHIATYTAGPVDVESASAQMTMLFKLVNTSVEKLGAGTVEDNLLTTDRAYLLIRYLSGNEYYLGIAADRRASNLGSIRLYSRIYAERLSKAIPH